MNKERIIQIGQWIAIVLLTIACFCFWWKSNKSIVSDANYNKTSTQYVNVASDKSLSELKKENEELYDSIKNLTNVKEAIQIKYVTRYNSDTVYIGNVIQEKDSTYHYTHTSDTIKYSLDINGSNVKWFKLGFSVQDSLMIVTRSNNGQNETTIVHSDKTDINDVTVFVPKTSLSQKLKERLYFGVGVGAGYGFFSKKPDIYIGINAGIKF